MEDGSGKTLLVVEDDAATASFLADNLRADGYRVIGATGAAEALRAVESRRPDLVLLDLGLAAGSGLEVLDRVRSAASTGALRIDPDLPVIVLTGRSGEVDRVRGFARGADDFVCKPTAYLCAGAGSGVRVSTGKIGVSWGYPSGAVLSITC